MMEAKLTNHAQLRLQQRAIPLLVVELLERFGASVRGNRAETLFFDLASRRELRRYLGGDRGLRLIEGWLDVYMVVGDDGAVITAGHRTQPLRRDGLPSRRRRASRRHS